MTPTGTVTPRAWVLRRVFTVDTPDAALRVRRAWEASGYRVQINSLARGGSQVSVYAPVPWSDFGSVSQ